MKAGKCCTSTTCRRCFGSGDPDAWLAKPQPSAELCRLFHGIGCQRGCPS